MRAAVFATGLVQLKNLRPYLDPRIVKKNNFLAGIWLKMIMVLSTYSPLSYEHTTTTTIDHDHAEA